jgi:hypothetical protein
MFQDCVVHAVCDCGYNDLEEKDSNKKLKKVQVWMIIATCPKYTKPELKPPCKKA